MKIITRLLTMLAFAGWAGSVSAAQITAADAVTVNGTTWAQVDLFTDLSWNDINIVCPGGVCVNGGMLNGYIMTGWTWASVDEASALFNYYIGSPELGPYYEEKDSVWADAVIADGWRAITQPGFFQEFFGWTATPVIAPQLPPINAYFMAFHNIDPSEPFKDRVAVESYLKVSHTDYLGGFFYTTQTLPPPEVPAPPTLALFGLGLVGISLLRRKRSIPA